MSIDFDNFVTCLVRLETMYSEWTLLELCKLPRTQPKYSFVLLPAETFDSLDTDKDKIISLNFFQVGFRCSSSSILRLFSYNLALICAPQWISLTMFA